MTPRSYRTHPDRFAAVGAEVCDWLRAEPGLTAQAVLQRLRQQHGSRRFPDRLRRTLQRRLKDWRSQLPGSLFDDGELTIFLGVRQHDRERKRDLYEGFDILTAAVL